MVIKEAIHEVINGKDLSYEMAQGAMKEIMSGEASQVLMATYLTALRMKGETITEITASAQAMRDLGVHLAPDYDVLEIVGTGGDEVGTFNISTTAAFVIAAAGIPVAKHGNRSVSSKSGAADVLESLGADITIDDKKSKEVLDKVKMSFLFAQYYHSSMKNVGPVRKEMGERTIFNILGPLTNPANASIQLLGVYNNNLVEKLAEVLKNLGVKRGMVVYGQDCLDEISMSAPTTVCEFGNGEFKKYVIEPEQFGFEKCDKNELVGGNPEENAAITKAILQGEKGPKRDAVALNAGAALYIGGKADTFEEGVRLAEKQMDNGQAMETLQKFVTLSNQD